MRSKDISILVKSLETSLFPTDIFVFPHSLVILPSPHSITARLSFPIVLTVSPGTSILELSFCMGLLLRVAIPLIREIYEFVSIAFEE